MTEKKSPNRTKQQLFTRIWEKMKQISLPAEKSKQKETPASNTVPQQVTCQEPEASMVLLSGMQPNRHTKQRIFAYFLFGLLFFSLYLLYRIAEPFLHAIILACMFAAISFPFYRWVLRHARNCRTIAAILVMLCVILLVIIPFWVLIVGLIPQATQAINDINQWLIGKDLQELLAQYLTPWIERLQEEAPFIQLSAQEVQQGLIDFSRKGGQMLLQGSTYFVTNTLKFLLHFMLMCLIMFFLLLDGPDMVEKIKKLSPLREEQNNNLLQNLRRMSRSILVGGLFVAALQGFVGGVGLAIVGIPPLFWGTLMAFAALVPVVGTGLIWIPMLLYLGLIEGDWTRATILAVWCGVGVSSIDSFLRPFLVKGSSNTSVLFIFLSIFGGINAFGMLGLIYGPVILTFASVMLAIYSEEFGYFFHKKIEE